MGFWKTLSRNFKLLLFRDSLGMLFNSLTRQYTSIYLTKLGASALDISSLEGAASLLRMVLAIPAGLFIDRVKSIKRLYVFSGLLMLPVTLVKGLAQSFQDFFAARMWETIGFRINMPTVNIINISSITNRDRVKGMVTSRMVISILGLVAPIIAAFTITYFGGLENVDSFRPLFIIQFIGSLVIFIVMATKLEEPAIQRRPMNRNILSNFSEIFQAVPGLKWILLMEMIRTFFMGIRMPLMGLYFYEMKKADAYILGLQSTVGTAVTLLFSVPMGNITERVGRRRMGYLSQIVFAICVLVPIFTPSTNPEFLLLYNALSAFGGTMELGWFAFIQEYIPLDMRGRWAGISTTIMALVGIPAPLIGGYIWDINPDYLWWIAFIYYLIIAIPFMQLVPNKKEENVITSGS